MDNFTIRTKIAPKDYVKVMYIGMYKKPVIIIITFVGLYYLIPGVLDYLHVTAYRPDLPVFNICYGLFLLSLPSILLLMALKRFKSNKNLSDFITYTFGETGFAVQGITFKAEFLWPHVVKQKEVGKFLVLYHDKRTGNFIDKTMLTPEQLNFIKSKVGQRA